MEPRHKKDNRVERDPGHHDEMPEHSVQSRVQVVAAFDLAALEVASDRNGETEALDDGHHDRAPPHQRAAVQNRGGKIGDVERPAAHGFSSVKYHAMAGGMETSTPMGSHQTLKTEPINPVDIV